MPNQEKDDKASSSPSSGGYSGYGGQDSPGERGGRGTTGSSSNTSTSSSKGSSSSSGTVGSPNDKTSYGDSRMGTGRDSSSIGGRDNSDSGSSYSGYGGEDSPSERGGRGTSGSPSSVSSTNVADRFDSGSNGLAQAYRDMADSATKAGISNLAGDTYSRSQPVDQTALSNFRQVERESMNKLYDYEKSAERVVDAGPGWTKVELRDGTIETRVGDRASRNNNPGNIEYGNFTKSLGAIGTDGRFAVFSDRQAGVQAIGSLLDTKGYRDKTVMGAIEKYAPRFENNTDRYASTVAKAAGVTTDTKLSDMSREQRNAMAQAMMAVEGNTGYKTTTNVAGVSYGTAPDGTTRQPTGLAAAFRDPYASVQTPGYNPEPAKKSSGQQAINQIAAPSTDRFKSTYLGTPDTGPVPGAKPQQELTTGQKIAAGAIDIGSGFIPGIGTGLGLVNAGLQITGNQTIGERIVRGAGAGTTPLEDQAGTSTADNGAVEMQTKAEETVTAKAATPPPSAPPVERFVSTYLRPTPREKWARA